MSEQNETNGRWWRPSKWKLRDILLFVGGLTLLTNEALREEVPRKELLLVYVAMMLGPSFLAFFGDGAKKKDDE